MINIFPWVAIDLGIYMNGFMLICDDDKYITNKCWNGNGMNMKDMSCENWMWRRKKKYKEQHTNRIETKQKLSFNI